MKVKRIPNIDISVDKLRLHASERNEDFSTELFEKFLKSIQQSSLKYYPNLSAVYSKIKKFYNVDNLIIGNGSDRCIEHFIQAYRRTYKNLILFDPSFPMYNVYGQLYGYNIAKVPQENLDIPYTKFLNSIDSNSIVILTNPSSPLGQILDTNFIKQVLDKQVPVLLDEAYMEFSNSTSFLPLITKYPNLFITKTFSKALGSAGIRLGFITGSAEGIETLHQYRSMFEVSSLTALWGEILLDNYQEVVNYTQKVKKVRDDVEKKCKLKNVPLISGHSNWVHIVHSSVPENIIIKSNCKIPGDTRDWIRLQITSNINDYSWI